MSAWLDLAAAALPSAIWQLTLNDVFGMFKSPYKVWKQKYQPGADLGFFVR